MVASATSSRRSCRWSSMATSVSSVLPDDSYWLSPLCQNYKPCIASIVLTTTKTLARRQRQHRHDRRRNRHARIRSSSIIRTNSDWIRSSETCTRSTRMSFKGHQPWTSNSSLAIATVTILSWNWHENDLMLSFSNRGHFQVGGLAVSHHIECRAWCRCVSLLAQPRPAASTTTGDRPMPSL